MKRNWRKWIIGAALILACAESVLLWNGRDKYLRYVSPPLSEGTRYTFLYPARLTSTKITGMDLSIKGGPPAPSTREKVLIWLGWPQKLVPEEFSPEEISVRVYPSRELSYRRDFSVPFGSNFVLTDARSKNGFAAFHIRASNFPLKTEEEESTWLSTDEVFSKSFQILPPSAPAPSP